MTQKKRKKDATPNRVGNLRLHLDRPTRVKVEALYLWVIWQYPQERKAWLLGAVHPPAAHHGWYPALIDTKKGRVRIFGHISQPFDSPELARDYILSDWS